MADIIHKDYYNFYVYCLAEIEKFNFYEKLNFWQVLGLGEAEVNRTEVNVIAVEKQGAVFGDALFVDPGAAG